MVPGSSPGGPTIPRSPEVRGLPLAGARFGGRDGTRGRGRFLTWGDPSEVTTRVTTLDGGDRDALLIHIRAVKEIQQAVLARLERIEEAVAAR